MSFLSTIKSWFTSEKTATEARLKAVESKVDLIFRNTLDAALTDVKPIEADLKADAKVLEGQVKPLVADEKQALKGSILQALNDAKAELKNAEPGLTADAESAVDAVIKAAVEAMIKDGVEAV